MGIKKEVKNGKELWHVYVNIRSKKNNRRMQKYSRNCKTEALAKKEEKRLIREISIELQKLDEHGLSWRDIIIAWEKDLKSGVTKQITRRTILGYLSIIEHWTHHWMDRPAGLLTIADGRSLARSMNDENLSYAYMKKVKNLINKVFKWGIEERMIPSHIRAPLEGVNIGRKIEKMPEILSLEEIKKFLSTAEALNHRWYPIWVFAILTGMRSGELYALQWEKIDLEKNIIYVEKSYDSNVKEIGPTKGRYWRTVPISEDLGKIIFQLKRGDFGDHGEFVLPRLREWYHGDQAVPLKAFLKSINIKPVKFHTLRACFATQMLAHGVAAPIVMKIGGWKNSSTMDIYLRLSGVDVKGATDCLKLTPSDISFGDNVIKIENFK